ncbi:ABC transporter permease [Hymenobacter norwichensis]|uniref:ABC transporter permease n=1 Tax=Hymenobacter norwichensis TaxID=223903 RepID=UPI0003B6E357|nr:ABC transporter permease [Hymenobacter norwichensis]
MVRQVLRRLFQLLLTAWGIITLLFLLTRTLPDDQQLLSRFTDTTTGTTASGEQVRQAQQARLQRLGLAEPVFYASRATVPIDDEQLLISRWHWNGTHNQYHHWLRDVVHGNLGRSYRTGEPVAGLLGSALLITLPLSGLAALFIVVFSLLLGLLLASRPHTGWVAMGLYTLDSMPLFVVALLLLLLLANPDFLTLFPTYGLGLDNEAATSLPLILTAPAYAVLPVASLVLTGLAEPTLQLAAALRHELQFFYILTARAKGLSSGRVLRRHAFRNALLPILTLYTELLPNLLAGSVVVELIFALPGLGRLLADAAAARDYPVLVGGVAMVVLTRQFSLLLADWLYQLADPRIRTTG